MRGNITRRVRDTCNGIIEGLELENTTRSHRPCTTVYYRVSPYVTAPHSSHPRVRAHARDSFKKKKKEIKLIPFTGEKQQQAFE